jgi:hypothetical protein
MGKTNHAKRSRPRSMPRSRSRSRPRAAKKKTKRLSRGLSGQKKLVLKMVEDMKWPKTKRHNVLRKGQKGYEGFALGKVTSWAGKGENAGYKKIISLKTREPKYNTLFKETKKLLKLKDPKFKFSSVQFNKNHRAAKHIDGRNMGVSYIIGLGDYTGGELITYDEDGSNPQKHDIHDKFYKFNGSVYPHETAPYKGTRYTFVFYNI